MVGEENEIVEMGEREMGDRRDYFKLQDVKRDSILGSFSPFIPPYSNSPLCTVARLPSHVPKSALQGLDTNHSGGYYCSVLRG